MKTVCVPRGGGWLPLLLLLALHAPAWSSPSRHDRQAYYNPDNTVRDCGFVTSYNNTYFVSPGYDNIDTGTGICTITVNLLSNICQLRLEFIEFEIAQPDDEGFCMTDFFGVSGASEDVPAICGTNTGLHMYVNVAGQSQVMMVVDRYNISTTRLWNILIQQIACDSPYRAPDGCLQYFTESSGTVTSFNFAQPDVPTNTRQIANMEYAACVATVPGYCSITWEANSAEDGYGFVVSGDALVDTPGDAGGEIFDPAICAATDNVIIFGGEQPGGITSDYYCGTAFPTSVTTTRQPFKLVVTQNDEETASGDIKNNGFSLNYRQTPFC